MIRQNIDSFVLGEDAYPSWFVEDYGSSVDYRTAADGKLLGINIKSPAGMITANSGDTLMSVNGLLTVVPKAAAERYMK